MKQEIEQLIVLQEKDIVLDKIRNRIELIPAEVKEYEDVINSFKVAAEAFKGDLQRLQLSKKEKELELQTKENEIKKHSTELNAIKTNDAYKALLKEIEKSRQDKQLLEDDILQIMMDIDKKTTEIKEEEKKLQTEENMVKGKSDILKNELERLQKELNVLEPERNEYLKQIPDVYVQKYEHIRQGRQGIAIAPIEGENCGGCNITLRPQIINDVFKGQDIVYCDSCSRMLYKK